MAQHLVRMVVFRDRFLERHGRDGADSSRVPASLWPGHVCLGARSASRHWQNDICLFDLLDIHRIRPIPGDLVRRSSNRDFLYRATLLAPSMDAFVLVHPNSNLGNTVPGSSRCTAQTYSGNLGNSFIAWTNRGMVSELYPGGALALA